MADNKVTIDAAWFDELRRCENEVAGRREADCVNCHIAKERDELKTKVNAYEPKINELDAANLDAYEKIAHLRKERDELKARLDGEDGTLSGARKNAELFERERNEARARLAAAERCIDDVAKKAFYNLKAEYLIVEDVQNTIRAYREKEAK